MKNSIKPEPWQDLPVHPAAEKLPMMSEQEIKELADDIKENGLREPIVLFTDNTEEPQGAKGPFTTYLLEGRNRLAALKLLGIKDPNNASMGDIGFPESKTYQRVRRLKAFERDDSVGFDMQSERLHEPQGKKRWRKVCDPEIFVLSMNVHRRHLTSDQKREAIVRFIKADPKASDNEVAKTLKVSPHTVAGVRKQSDQNLQNATNDHLPIERARTAIRKNPGMSIRDLAKIADVSYGVARKAHHEYLEERIAANRAGKPDPAAVPLQPQPVDEEKADDPVDEEKADDPVDEAIARLWRRRPSEWPIWAFREFVSDAIKIPGSISIVEAALAKFEG